MSSAAGPAALPPGSATRALHVELPSQQRRLRHLRNIAARNIINKNGYRLLDTYFTLHLCDNAKIYKGKNPTWRSLDFGIMPDRLDTSVSCFVVRIWGGKKEHFQLLIEWKVNLDGLKYLGQQIHARNPNEIIFGLNDGYYGASFEQKDHSGTLKNSLLQVDQNCVRNSYDVFSLLRLHRAQCAIKQTQVTVQKIGREIEEKLRCTSTSNELKKESECLQLKILVLRNELERQKKALGQEVALLHKEKSTLHDRGNAFETEYQKLQEHNESLHELRKECTAKRELFLKTNAQQTIRCKQLLSELSYIYPIDLNDQKDYFVCGVKLPNSEDFQAKDDGSIAVALGYTAHLVSMISYFLQVPLRYPIIHKGSRSTIKDNINDKLTEKEREFPLYPKGGEKLQFEYGVYLLNKNIAQYDMSVHLDRHHTSSAIPVPKRQSSSFGRLDIGFSSGLPSPDKGLRKRASTGNERLQYKTPPPSYNSALTQPVAITARVGELDKKPGSISSSLDTSMDSSKGNTRKGEDLCSSLNGENGSLNNAQEQQESFLGHSSAINGAFLPAECSGTASNEQPCEFRPSLGPVLCCTVEQAEEIMGMEATGFSTGDQLEDFNSIPVEHAVAVECDEQVLGEFEEFSRRIYALNENMSSFRRPRKSSDK
uniref:UV radiation resistance associated n=1 Tax=Strix occidentalis caurina TaxID=311401 RepID=A0A8D0FKY2_STROC